MDVVVWKEKGLSNVKQAESRYQRILADDESVPIAELDEQLQAFIRQASQELPEAIVKPGGSSSPVDATYSRFGVVLRFDPDRGMEPVAQTADIATPLDLTIYYPSLETPMVEGYDDSEDEDIEIFDND
jgi:hypothetical protein